MRELDKQDSKRGVKFVAYGVSQMNRIKYSLINTETYQKTNYE